MNASKMFAMLTQRALMFLVPINVYAAQDLQETGRHVKVRNLEVSEGKERELTYVVMTCTYTRKNITGYYRIVGSTTL